MTRLDGVIPLETAGEGSRGPYSFYIYLSGGVYYALDALGVVDSSNATFATLIDALVTEDGLHVHFSKATYVFDGLVTIDKNEFVITADPYTIFDCGTNGRFLLASAGEHPVNGLNGLFGFEFDGNNRTVIADGAHATYPFIDSAGFTTVHRCENLNIHDTYFYDWRDSNSVLHLYNLEESQIDTNWFAGIDGQATLCANDGAFIVLDTDDYNAGNVYISRNFFNAWASADEWYADIYIKSMTGSKEYTNVKMSYNHGLNDRSSSCKVKHIVLNSDGGVIRDVRSTYERMESLDLWDIENWDSQYKWCEIDHLYADGGAPIDDADFMHIDENWKNRFMKIHHNTFSCKANKNLLNTNQNGATGEETLFYSNYVNDTGAGTLVANASNIFERDNYGYGCLGWYQTDTGAWSSPTGFARNGSKCAMYNSTAGEYRVYWYLNSGWRYEELT